jgi:deoxyribodipyrimidine photo-lyase
MASNQYKKALFIFRRDLRLEDNTGLLFALEHAKEVLPCFIFTPEQLENNSYRGDRSLQFMLESLEELAGAIEAKSGKLSLFHGKPEVVVAEAIEQLQINAVVVNRDYTPYSIERDEKIQAVCETRGIDFHSFDDALLHAPEETLKADGTPYTVFTPFYRNALKQVVPRPKENNYRNYSSDTIAFSADKNIYHALLSTRAVQAPGGRKAALEILKRAGSWIYYESTRDFPEKESTTQLSAHLKFTTCSIREAYWKIADSQSASCELLRALYWRDFFTGIAFQFPHVFSGAFKPQYNQLIWNNDPEQFKGWCEGKTGFPIVDAGMRQLNQTGFMHNRVRMITASFLVKDLHIDWRWGEKYFAQTLIDYDPAVNNGNWQWAASCGCDAQPYFRIFNPWTQGEKFDGNCLYIKQWIPELTALPPKQIHQWHKPQYHLGCPEYPPPIVDHAIESKIALASYKHAAA